jgi:NitT/TauT family transport system permease protein
MTEYAEAVPGGDDRRAKWSAATTLIVCAALWEIASRRALISPVFFPPPSVIVTTIIRLFVLGDLFRDTGATLGRVAIGLVLGGVPGFLVGLVMGWSRRVRTILDPLIAAVQPLPKIALFPLVLILFGLGESSKIVIVALGAFFPMVINTMAGVRAISSTYFDVAECYGAGRLMTFTDIVVPGSLPMAFAGLRLAFNLALLITITVELLSARQGLGAVIWMARETLRIEELYAALVVIACIGIACNALLRCLSGRLIPWQPFEHA